MKQFFPFIGKICNKFHFKKINLSIKEGSLFCFVIIRYTKPKCFRLSSWCQAVDEGGGGGRVDGLGSMTFGLVVQIFFNIELF